MRMGKQLQQQEIKEKAMVVEGMHGVMPSLESMAKAVLKSKDETPIIEWAYNTVQTTTYEYQLAVDTLLQDHFGWSESQLDEFHEEMRDLLLSLGVVHDAGHNPMSLEDMKKVAELSKYRYPEEKRLVLQKTLGLSIPQEMKQLK